MFGCFLAFQLPHQLKPKSRPLVVKVAETLTVVDDRSAGR